jgi:hypothetical protein
VYSLAHGGENPLWILHAYQLYKENLNKLQGGNMKSVTTKAVSTTSQPERPLLFTIARTMHELGISRSTVNRWADEGKLTKHVLGPGTARITTASIYSLLGMQ